MTSTSSLVIFIFLILFYCKISTGSITCSPEVCNAELIIGQSSQHYQVVYDGPSNHKFVIILFEKKVNASSRVKLNYFLKAGRPDDLTQVCPNTRLGLIDPFSPEYVVIREASGFALFFPSSSSPNNLLLIKS